jgi:hypothetical protein
MARKLLNLCLSIIFISLTTYAEHPESGDIYNSFLWNRKNHISKNGKVDSGDWFEWWYYKVIDSKSQDAFYFIYGVLNPWDYENTLAGTKAIVSVGNFKQHVFTEKSFPLNQFNARYDQTEINIGNNTATDKRIRGRITEEDGREISWDLAVNKKWAFNAMGWGMRVPDLSGIYWYPAQASADMTGWIKFHGKTYKFENAPAYQDRNWGRSFPQWWTWLVSNSFKNSPGTTLAAGGGAPKVLDAFYRFSGLCIGLNYQGREYSFRTTDADTVKFDIRWGVWKVWAQNLKGQRIEISAYAPPDKFMRLPAPTPRGPIFNDYEALMGQMTVKLSEWSFRDLKWNEVSTLETNEAGIEWGSPDPIGSFSFTTIFNSTLNLQ